MSSAFTIIHENNSTLTIDINEYTGKIEEVQCISDLDEGSDNCGSGGIIKGFIYGNEYKFKVTKYSDDDVPTDSIKQMIKWEFSYIDDDGNVIIGTSSEKTGDTFSFKVNDLQMLGKNITVYAYLSQKEDEGSLIIFCHYRFRQFDRQIINQQILRRKLAPWEIDQGSSSLCGIALTGYYLARDNFDDYKYFIEEIHKKGVAKLSNTNYMIEIDSDEHLLEYKISNSNYPEQSASTNHMAEIDFIFLLALRDHLNNVWDYDPDNDNVGGFIEGGTGLTLPHEIKMMFEKINGYGDLIKDTNLITSKWENVKTSIQKLKGLVKDNYKIALFIEATAFENNKKSSFSVPNHWVGLIDIVDNPKNEEVEVLLYTWGSITNRWVLSYDVFKDSYYGFIAGK